MKNTQFLKKIGYLQYYDTNSKITLFLNINKIPKTKECFFVSCNIYDVKFVKEVSAEQILLYMNGEISIDNLLDGAFDKTFVFAEEEKFFNEDLCNDCNKIEWILNIFK